MAELGGEKHTPLMIRAHDSPSSAHAVGGPPVRKRWEAGFALPAVLLLIAILTVLLTTGHARVASDVGIASAGDAIAAASVVARSGLQTYFGTLTLDACEFPVRPADGDSVRINVTGGYADAVARVVRRPADSLANWLFLVRSTGYFISPADGSTPLASRTVAQFAEWQSGQLGLPAAFMAANGLFRIAGGTGQFHGADEHPTAGCPQPDRSQLSVESGIPSLTDYDLTGLAPQSNGSGALMVTNAGIDWAAVLTPGRITPDFTSPQTANMNYPVQLVTGNATLGSAGATITSSGLLVVSGDLTVLGSLVQWYGVVLVGGRIHFDAADQRFDGFVASGLNKQLGMNPSSGGFGGDYTDIDFNSLYVARAMRPLTGFAPVENAYVEFWKTY